MTPKTEMVMPGGDLPGLHSSMVPLALPPPLPPPLRDPDPAALPSAAAILAAVLPPLPDPPLPEEWMENPAAALAAMEASE